jgi:hypothetical protein
MIDVSKKYCKENQITHFILNDVLENPAEYEIMLKNLYSQAGHRSQYGARTFNALYLRLQIQAQNIYNLLIFHCTISRTISSILHIECLVTNRFLLNTCFICIVTEGEAKF